MPGFFHSQNTPALQERLRSVDREIESLMRFRRRIEARIERLNSKERDTILAQLIETGRAEVER